MAVTLSELKKVLDTHGERYHILALSEQEKLLIWEDRGRIYGPFTHENSVGMAWIPKKLSTPEGYDDFLEEGNWNAGGDRMWIAPEFPFFTKERAKFNESYTVQNTLDPGHYHFTKLEKDCITMTASLEAELYEHTYDRKYFRATRTIKPCRNPLNESKFYGQLLSRLSYCGFTQTIELRDESPLNPMALEIWNLFQVRAGGVFLIPYCGKKFEYVDYYTPSEGKVLHICEDYAAIRVASCAEHKVGAKAYQTVGRVGYLLQNDDDSWSLLVRNYHNDPSDLYIKEPSDRPGENGCSLFIYMNDTRGDGFAELETAGQTFGAPENCGSTLSLNYWFFRGTRDDLQEVASILLGIDTFPEV